jgi:hypothetical protein
MIVARMPDFGRDRRILELLLFLFGAPYPIPFSTSNPGKLLDWINYL